MNDNQQKYPHQCKISLLYLHTQAAGIGLVVGEVGAAVVVPAVGAVVACAVRCKQELGTCIKMN